MDLKGSSFSLRKKDYYSKNFKSNRLESRKNIFEVKIPFVRCEKNSLELEKEFKEPIKLKSENKIVTEGQIRKKFRVPFLPESLRRSNLPYPLTSSSISKFSPKHNYSNTNDYIRNQKRSSSTLNTRYRELKQFSVPGKYKEIVVILNNLLS